MGGADLLMAVNTRMSDITREAILQALRECDRMERDQFLWIGEVHKVHAFWERSGDAV